MPEPLKNLYNEAFFKKFVTTVKQVVPHFNEKQFLQDVFNNGWDVKELKQRVRHIASLLKKHLPGNYKEQLTSIICIIEQLKENDVKPGFEYMFFPDFIEQYGLDEWKTSLTAIETITQFISCEFAIRPFLLQHQDEVMLQMVKWSKHKHHHVRRFSSEGCRPRLPWAMAIPALKKDPSPIIAILENLKDDESLFVRKTVANNLNDIAKDHPDLVVNLVRRWKGKSKETDWIIRHGSRTLLKKAHPSAYELFGLNGAASCKIFNLKLNTSRLKIGDKLHFSFELITKSKPAKLRLEYAVYYTKASGRQNRKIFQLTENSFQSKQTISFKKQQSFQDFTTRKHYPGKHKIAIVVNGRELAEKEFILSA